MQRSFKPRKQLQVKTLVVSKNDKSAIHENSYKKYDKNLNYINSNNNIQSHRTNLNKENDSKLSNNSQRFQTSRTSIFKSAQNFKPVIQQQNTQQTLNYNFNSPKKFNSSINKLYLSKNNSNNNTPENDQVNKGIDNLLRQSSDSTTINKLKVFKNFMIKSTGNIRFRQQQEEQSISPDINNINTNNNNQRETGQQKKFIIKQLKSPQQKNQIQKQSQQYSQNFKNTNNNNNNNIFQKLNNDYKEDESQQYISQNFIQKIKDIDGYHAKKQTSQKQNMVQSQQLQSERFRLKQQINDMKFSANSRQFKKGSFCILKKKQQENKDSNNSSSDLSLDVQRSNSIIVIQKQESLNNNDYNQNKDKLDIKQFFTQQKLQSQNSIESAEKIVRRKSCLIEKHSFQYFQRRKKLENIKVKFQDKE